MGVECESGASGPTLTTQRRGSEAAAAAGTPVLPSWRAAMVLILPLSRKETNAGLKTGRGWVGLEEK